MNRDTYRSVTNKAFLGLSTGSVVLLALCLLLILTPMFWRGAGAVFFRGTVEFRRMQFELPLFERGAEEAVKAEVAAAAAARQPVYDLVEQFRRGIDTSRFTDEARGANQRYGEHLRAIDADRETYRARRALAREVRDHLAAALESTDEAEARRHLAAASAYAEDEAFVDSPAEAFFALAREYEAILDDIDLSRRDVYAVALEEVQQALRGLFGPLPGEPRPPLAMHQYGATRWDQAQKELDNLLYATEWREVVPGEALQKVRVARTEQFAGTSLEALFPLVEGNIEAMLRPRFTFHWQYFIDDSTPGHYFGGVGPEIIGTLWMTAMAMLFAVPLGIISAGYLVECAGDNLPVRAIRTCVNTLAGVPSIVFGLFGLAFFVLFLLPLLGLPGQKCILAAGMTLAVLVLPVIIRASEEAIRSVPQSYKEASLALGAGRFRTFMVVTLPAALPGILTGIILSLSRAAGETAPILFTGAVALGPRASSVLDPTRALSYGSYDIAVGDRLAALVPHQQYGMVMTLILLILLLNIVAIALRSRMSRKLRGY